MAPSRRTAIIVNAVAFQLVWFAAVIGAAHGYGWAGPAALLVFAAWQLQRGVRKRGDVTLMLVALATGFTCDTIMVAGGFAIYASPFPGAPIAPAWILALWAGFGLTLQHSLAWLVRRPWLAVVLGGTLGPLSYLGAQRAFAAVSFAEPRTTAIVMLAMLWAMALGVLSTASRRSGGFDMRATTIGGTTP